MGPKRGGQLALAGISDRQRISLSYLEQLFSRLRRQGLVSSVRGPGGGYKLAKNYTDISVADVINAVDEQIDATQCGGHENCRDEGRCMTHDLWESLNQHMFKFLDAITLEKIVKEQLDNGWTEDGFSATSKKKMTAKPIKINAPNSVFNMASFGGFGGSNK